MEANEQNLAVMLIKPLNKMSLAFYYFCFIGIRSLYYCFILLPFSLRYYYYVIIILP